MLAQSLLLGGYSLPQLGIVVVVIAAIVALVCVALHQFGIAVPPWVIQVFWIIVVAFVVILGIKIITGIS